MVRRLAIAYFAGAVAGLVASLALWIAGRAELTAALGVSIAPPLAWDWLSRRVLWGGLWGLGFPWVARRDMTPVRAGLALSLVPSCAELFWALPSAGHQLLGVGLGALTPIVVLLANAVWGWTLARVVVAAGGSGGE
jgi:hypothetical protein